MCACCLFQTLLFRTSLTYLGSLILFWSERWGSPFYTVAQFCVTEPDLQMKWQEKKKEKKNNWHTFFTTHNRTPFQIPHRKMDFLSGFRCQCSCPAETKLMILAVGVVLRAGQREEKRGRGKNSFHISPVPQSSLIQPALLSGRGGGKC